MNQLALKIDKIKTTQREDVLNYLQQHGSLTRGEAFYELGICELSSRIGELEKDGWDIPRKMITVTARNGRRVSVMQYLTPHRKQDHPWRKRQAPRK